MLFAGGVKPFIKNSVIEILSGKLPDDYDVSIASISFSIHGIQFKNIIIQNPKNVAEIETLVVKVDFPSLETKIMKLQGVKLLFGKRVNSPLANSSSVPTHHAIVQDFKKLAAKLQNFQSQIIGIIEKSFSKIDFLKGYFSAHIEIRNLYVELKGQHFFSCDQLKTSLSLKNLIQAICINKTEKNSLSKQRLVIGKSNSSNKLFVALGESKMIKKELVFTLQQKLENQKGNSVLVYLALDSSIKSALNTDMFGISELKLESEIWLTPKKLRIVSSVSQLNVSQKSLSTNKFDLPSFSFKLNHSPYFLNGDAKIYLGPNDLQEINQDKIDPDILVKLSLQGQNSHSRLRLTGKAIKCSKLLKAMPPSIREKFSKMQMTGHLNLKLILNLAKNWRNSYLGSKFENFCKFHNQPSWMEIDTSQLWQSPFLSETILNRGILDPEPITKFHSSLKRSVLGFEDHYFYQHQGFWIASLFEALRRNLASGKVKMGGSTISMQLAKNLFLKNIKSFERKLTEFILTLYLESELTKDQILEIYLNIVEMGPDLYGFPSAADIFFGKDVSSIDIREAAFLASLLPNPKKRYKSFCFGRLSKSLYGYITRRMNYLAKIGKISELERITATNRGLVFNPQKPAYLCE